MTRTRILLPIAFGLSLTGVALTGAMAAQAAHDSGAPIDFSAAHIELQDKAKQAILSGDVVVKQANMTLDAARMTVHYTGQIIGGSPQISRLDAAGGVTVVRPGQRASAQYAVYDLNNRVVTLLGNVRLQQGSNTLNGGRAHINLDSGLATMDGSAVGNGSGTTRQQNGRVTGTFSAPKRNP